MSVGFVSASQGSYSPEQLLLDIGQGARVGNSSYDHPSPPSVRVRTDGRSGAALEGWGAVRRRAGDAPQLLVPGLLASSVPGGAAYVGTDALGPRDAVAAAGRSGQITAYSLGSAASLLGRINALAARYRLLVTDLPAGAPGLSDLRALAANSRDGRLVLALQRSEDPRAGRLLWLGAAGLPGGGAHALSSPSTNQKGLVSAVDLAPTILHALGLALPADMRGEPIETTGSLDGRYLRGLMQRLRVLGGRRLPALGFLMLAWVLLLLASVATPAARARALGSGALRAGALGVLWIPVVMLLPAALEPSADLEYAIVALACPLLGGLTDRLLAWPRAPLAPAVVAVLAVTVDALAHSQLVVRSLLGPNPILGARFYGFGNELKPGLAVAVLAGVAAFLYPATRGRRAVLAFAGAGVVLAAIEGAARIGAGVGSVIFLGAGFAVAAALAAPGTFDRRRALAVLAAPLLALIGLAVIDLVTAHGSGHFTGSILHARSAGDVRDVIVRRYGAAWRELHNHAMPIATALMLGCAAIATRRRERLLAHVALDPAWLAALGGGLACGLVGSLVEDSGPVLFAVSAFALGAVLCYLQARPPIGSAERIVDPPVRSATSSAGGAVTAGAVDHDLVL